jgi:hypothetical protein
VYSGIWIEATLSTGIESVPDRSRGGHARESMAILHV